MTDLLIERSYPSTTENIQPSAGSFSQFENALAADQTTSQLAQNFFGGEQETSSLLLSEREFEELSSLQSDYAPEEASDTHLQESKTFLKDSGNSTSRLKESLKEDSKGISAKDAPSRQGVLGKLSGHVASSAARTFSQLPASFSPLQPQKEPLHTLLSSKALPFSKQSSPSEKAHGANSKATPSSSKRNETPSSSLERPSRNEGDRSSFSGPAQRNSLEETSSTLLQKHEEKQDKDEKQEKHSSQQEALNESELADQEKRGSIDHIEKVHESSSKEVQDLDENQFNQEVQDVLDSFSNAFGYRVSPIDVIAIFFACMKLLIESGKQEKISRRQEREMQIAEMQKVVSTYKAQGKWLLFSGIGSGVLSIVGGMAPIVGHMKGDLILGKLQGFFSSLKGMKNKQFFDGVATICRAMSDMYKSTGEVQRAYTDGDLSRAQHLSDLARTDGEECTRTYDEILQEWRSIDNFLNHYLQMEHETARSLYN